MLTFVSDQFLPLFTSKTIVILVHAVRFPPLVNQKRCGKSCHYSWSKPILWPRWETFVPSHGSTRNSHGQRPWSSGKATWAAKKGEFCYALTFFCKCVICAQCYKSIRVHSITSWPRIVTSNHYTWAPTRLVYYWWAVTHATRELANGSFYTFYRREKAKTLVAVFRGNQEIRHVLKLDVSQIPFSRNTKTEF